MELLTAALRQKITQLIAIDEARQAAIPKDGIDYFSADENQVKARQELNAHDRTIANTLGELKDEELTVVTALTMYGNPHGSFDGNEQFADAMEDASEFVRTTERHTVVTNVAPKKFSEYLPAEIKRAKLA